jgi:hypothetical protein
MPYVDPDKRRTYHKEWNKKYYLKHRIQEIRRVAKRKAAQRIWLDDYRKNLECEICGENDPVCLDFHHRDAKLKDFSIANIKAVGWGKDRVLLEIQKCMVVCANCHRKIHAKAVK